MRKLEAKQKAMMDLETNAGDRVLEEKKKKRQQMLAIKKMQIECK